MSVAVIALIVLWWALIVYAVLGGADFGAGIWDLLAVGRQADRQHDLINHALGPVWEANHVWLIFLIVGLFTVFPSAFAAICTALFVPFTIALIGVVLRGAAFIFRYYATDSRSLFARSWSRVFSAASIITPFCLGASAAAVASGHLLLANGTASSSAIGSWTSPFALTIGAMAVALCAVLAAVYLSVEAHETEQDRELTESYRRKALVAGAVTAAFGLLGLVLAPTWSPVLWRGMLTHALPVVLLTMLIGLGAASTLYTRHYRLARILIIAEAAFLLGAWGLAQYPYLIPPYVTIEAAANEPTVIVTLLIGLICGMAIVIPSLYYLFSVFKLPLPVPGVRRKKPVGEARQTQKRAAVRS